MRIYKYGKRRVGVFRVRSHMLGSFFWGEGFGGNSSYLFEQDQNSGINNRRLKRRSSLASFTEYSGILVVIFTCMYVCKQASKQANIYPPLPQHTNRSNDPHARA